MSLDRHPRAERCLEVTDLHAAVVERAARQAALARAAESLFVSRHRYRTVGSSRITAVHGRATILPAWGGS